MPTKEEMQSLAEEIVRSYEDRISGIIELRETVKTDLKEFQEKRAVMAKNLRADLVKSVAARKAAVSNQLKELDAAHASMSQELKAGLAKVRPALEKEDKKRQSEAREFRGELGRAVAQGKAATQALLRDFSEAQAGVRNEWQKMTAIMQSKRSGVAGIAKPPIEEIAEGAASITPEIAALREKVFEYLANHPDGTKLVELAEALGVARIQIAKVVRSLMDENKIEKRDLLYFAV
ncbi:MAG: hypothetical protein QMD88_06920 [Coprothermobacterota bacterium]|nr:hypothetical protein [Coprothermobacterota bacterium]